MILGAFPISTKNSTTATTNNKNGKCRFLFLCGGYILFLVLGAAMFSAIEAPKIDVISTKVEAFRNQFLEKYTCLSDKLFEVGESCCKSLSVEKNFPDKNFVRKQWMSVVPLMFRDWWDELEFPTRTTRLLDQHFGTGLRRNDLMSSVWNSRPTMLRSGYLRPWQRTSGLQKQDSGSTLNINEEKFEVILDVQQFTPDEISVKVTDKFVIVEAKHEEKQDEHGFVSRQFTRRYLLPSDVNPDSVTSSLSSDGLLTVTAPMKKVPPPNTERVIHISKSGPSSKEDQEKKVETTTA